MYRVELTPRAPRELEEVPLPDRDAVVAALRALSEEPRPRGVRKLRDPIHRVRVGVWRIIYAVFDRDRLVVVGKMARRSENTYRGLEERF